MAALETSLNFSTTRSESLGCFIFWKKLEPAESRERNGSQDFDVPRTGHARGLLAGSGFSRQKAAFLLGPHLWRLWLEVDDWESDGIYTPGFEPAWRLLFLRTSTSGDVC
jgi:hypothetical protein